MASGLIGDCESLLAQLKAAVAQGGAVNVGWCDEALLKLKVGWKKNDDCS
jgi:hypothetical protein